MNPTPEELKSLVDMAIAKCGGSQTELSRRSGIAQSQISRYLKEPPTRVTLATYNRLRKVAYDITSDEEEETDSLIEQIEALEGRISTLEMMAIVAKSQLDTLVVMLNMVGKSGRNAGKHLPILIEFAKKIKESLEVGTGKVQRKKD